MNKLRTYIGETRRMSRSRQIPLAAVAFRVAVAYLLHRLSIRLFGLYELADKPVASYGEYMRMSELESLQRKANPSRAGRSIADSKLRFYAWCRETGLPTPTLFGYVADEALEFCNGVPRIRNEEHLMDLLEGSGTDTFLFKREYGSHGHGLLRIRYSSGHLLDDEGRRLDGADLLDRLRSHESAYLLQAAERPHRELKPVMPGPGLGTVRMITFNRDDTPHLAIACLRIPIGSNVADNFDCGQSGNILADVDVHTGRIGRCLIPVATAGYSVTQCATHPETGSATTGFVFPRWDAIRHLVASAAKELGSMYTVGWDAALTERGPTLLEVNWRYDIEIMQVLAGRGLRSVMLREFAPALVAD